MKIEILNADIFDGEKVIAGTTKSNYHIFAKGFSIFPGKIYEMDEVEQMRSLLSSNLGLKRENLVFQKQAHSDFIQVITNENRSFINQSDGMITNVKKLVLNVTVADCAAVLVYDVVSEAVGAFHSGWRGTAKNIVAKGVSMMSEQYGSVPKDMLAWVSPAAGADSYEVGAEVAELFPETVKRKKGEKYLLDIKQRIFEQLTELGISSSNIEISPICTITNREYHSYRRDGDLSGRMAGFIAML